MKEQYEQPRVEILALVAESVICANTVFGDEGAAGVNFFDEENILDGGTF